VGDLGWAATTAIDLPGEAPSGVYAVRMRSEDEEMHIPFAVRDQARVGLLLPTLTYLSYANHRMFTGRGDLFGYISDHEIGATERERLVVDHPYLGRSIYDLHEDGSGVSRVSRARPLVNLEPAQLDWLGDGPHHFAADLYIVGWLERAGVEYSVLTDEDLHTEGAAALEGCKVLITGSHPEYWTTPMMRAQRVYLEAGGNLMYLGGNGYYWVTSLSQDQVMMEVRRGFAGSRAWTSQPGETVHAFDHAEGGMWRNRGYGPHQIGGVGMASQGWGASVGYKRLPDSFDPRVSTFFEGIGKDEHIGNFGFLADGAAGYEVDRLDMRWGSPRGALRLATSQTLSDHYQLTVEEVENMSPGYGGTKTPEVRADMVWFETTAGGQVFSTGSIAWASALGWNGGANNVDTVTTNVLRSFLGTARREG
jgi:N,N-dimethylformamidase